MRRYWLQLLMGVALMGILFTFPVLAFVLPEQVAVLVNRQSPESVDLAKYYLERRSILLVNRVDLDLPITDTISRDVYEQDVLKPVRDALVKKELTNTIKVLVTIYGMPLRVQAPRLTTQEEEWIADARGWMQSAMGLLREQEQSIVKQKVRLSQSLQLSGEPIISSVEAGKDLTTSQIRTWRKQLTALLNELHQHIESMTNVEKKKTLFASREKIVRHVFRKVRVKIDSSHRSDSSRNGQREDVAIQQMLAGLIQHPSSTTRMRAYAAVQEAYGFWGILAFAQWEIARYQQADARASLDSELSFLWWDNDTYPLAGRLPNPFYLGYAGQVNNWPRPLLMVSRIDAPTVPHARRMIDQAIDTESEGLTGNVYVDARGMKKGAPLSYGYYDADMQDFAKQFRGGSQYSVTLENSEQRLSQPGQALDVALYVGWYRLRHYEDAFSFNPGAIGYHIASWEAVSIHNPNERGWCKNALERGITVTLGPVGEPYLDAFPLPTEFFGLLYSGKYSLVEAYYLSKRYVSWKMVLFGDPLYRPWLHAGAGQQQVAHTLLHKRLFPVSPTQRDFPAHDHAHDRSAFPGKYVPFHSKVLVP